MDGAKSIPSPFADAAHTPLQRNPPLAPSQELAYRNKCIQLKKRLIDIEKHNDSTRRLIAAEKERVQKQRLLRALLLNQLREIMETPGKKFSTEELEKLGIITNAGLDGEDLPSRHRPEGEALLDDSSENSDEDIPEPSDRPTRSRRPGPNPYRGEGLMTGQAQTVNTANYAPSTLPAIAPANAYSPAPAREQLLTTSFITPSGVQGSGSPHQHSMSHQSQYGQDSRYGQSSPMHGRAVIENSRRLSHGHGDSGSVRPVSSSGGPQAQRSPERPEVNGFHREAAAIPAPEKPASPYKQFYDHMKPQLEADNYPPHQIQDRIDDEWKNLSDENRELWQVRYHEQMRDYNESMEVWRRMTEPRYR